MKTEILIGLGIAAVAGVGIFIIAKKSFSAPAPIPTAKNPASNNSKTTAIITAGTSLAGDLFGWLTAPGNNTGSTNSTVTTPADTASTYASALDSLFA